ncbi:HET-domain-containing protein [Trametes coccinea BRFM310]|uniref:HET-domain-containing protein n=1 Tax=Trametes coccinea (strain BRFM310) TaxID=1353009 RepID=A0A1Y2IAC1_TRAC3|nr:HET-domain-containing protein [Trametes coccinea BRFM310]
MWLLHTRTAELEYFNSPHDVKGGYAILSHVWDACEQSFQELQSLHSQLVSAHRIDLLRSRVSDKVRECCILAESHGYEWLWIDTCCIDRSSSAELSEAINSMFQWYALAQVCYAYLEDVPSDQDIHENGSAFRKSKWFTRGWTLQELIAPRSLLFVARDWTVIGTKASLAALLEDITGVDADVLTFRRQLGDVSVARRMWWASARKTTRIEDEAYCLMGIFGVHMATIYGEGRRAFLRLQEEILKRTSDQTLFAWGNVLPIRTTPFREQMSYHRYHPDSHIFASSPAAFAHSGNMHPVPMQVAAENAVKTLGITNSVLDSSNVSGPLASSSMSGGERSLAHRHQSSRVPGHKKHSDVPWKIPLPDFIVTSHGVRARLLVVEASAGQSNLAIAVLACKDRSTGSFVGLLLRRRVDSETGLRWPQYHVGITVCGMHPWMRLRYRLSQVGWARHALSFNSSGISAHWERLYISHRPPSRPPARRVQSDAAFRFVFPRWVSVELAKQGFTPDVALPETRASAVKLAEKGSIASFTFFHRHLPEAFRIHIGLCRKTPWATASFISLGPQARPVDSAWTESSVSSVVPQHQPTRPPPPLRPANLRSRPSRRSPCECGPEAIARWTNSSRMFGDARRNVQLTFTHNSGNNTHLLDVRVSGSVYQNMLGRGSSGQPQRARLLHSLARRVLHVPL